MRRSLLPVVGLVSAASAVSYSCAGGHNNAWVLRDNFNFEVDAFCQLADGGFVFQEFPFSNTYDVLLTPRSGNPGVKASVTFSISNANRTPVFVVNYDTCYSILSGFAATGSSCYGSNNGDTKGGTATDGSITYTADIHPDVTV